MKIIADTTRPSSRHKTYLIEATHEELLKITGDAYAKVEIAIGVEIHVSEIYNAVKAVRQSRNRLTKAASELRAYSDELDGIRDRLCNPLGDNLDGR